MSMFDRYTTMEYVDGLRSYMGYPKRTFFVDFGFSKGGDQKKGRLRREDYKPELIEKLELEVNLKASRCEASDSTLGERIRLARDYLGVTDSDIARALGINRDLVRRWGADIHRPTCLPELASVLCVPQAWLEQGGIQNLPANTHLGVRVGAESRMWREQLLGMTQQIVSTFDDSVSQAWGQTQIEVAICNTFEYAQAARKAGGRWQLLNGTLLFAPWIPIPEHGLHRKLWSDEVEQIIEEELATKSVYGAYNALVARCKALGLSSDQYPVRISLNKRVAKEKQRIEKYGVNLNEMVAASVAQFYTH